MKPFELFHLPTGHIPTFNKDGTFSGPRRRIVPLMPEPDMSPSVCLLPKGESEDYSNNKWCNLLFEEKGNLLGVLEVTIPKVTVPMNNDIDIPVNVFDGALRLTNLVQENLIHLMRIAGGKPVSCFRGDVESTARQELGTEEIEIITSAFLKSNEVIAIDSTNFKGTLPLRKEHYMWGAIIFDTSKVVCLSTGKVPRMRWKMLRSCRGVV